jgi:hypothetical protein
MLVQKFTLNLNGFDQSSGKIRNPDGAIQLLSDKNEIAASWSYTSLLEHWRRKHTRAVYIPSLVEKIPFRKYKFGHDVILGTGTNFELFLQQMAIGNIYYDPGIKMENVSGNQKIKRRSQFRIKSGYLANLYHNNETIDLTVINDIQRSV